MEREKEPAGLSIRVPFTFCYALRVNSLSTALIGSQALLRELLVTLYVITLSNPFVIRVRVGRSVDRSSSNL